MKFLSACLLGILGFALSVSGASLDESSLKKFNDYDRQVASALTSKFAAGQLISLQSRVSKNTNEAVVDSGAEPNPNDIGSAYIHDWVGAIFIPGGSAERLETVLQDFDRHKDYFQPEVIESKLLSKNGDEFRNRLRLRKHKVITVILNTEYATRFSRVASGKGYSIARSTKISEVDNPGESDERELAPGTGHGFLWRLNSYWSWEERDGGLYVECRAVSLSRDVPMGLGWAVNPIIRSLPRESLAMTLENTRTAVLKTPAK